MNDTQILTIVLASAPTMLVVLIGILINNSRLNDTNNRIADLNVRFGELRTDLGGRISDINTRVTEIRAEMVTKAELRRMEEIIDARLKHLEER
jgi:hypothetical protein